MNYEDQSALFAPEKNSDDQFRLRRMQLYNWGTFSGVFDIDISPEGYLFVGPSGSGKSTILDANAALLTPPKWVDFNVAAREAEKGKRDRNLMSYVRGAWAEQTDESGEVASQYLRGDSTWSVIAQQFTDGHGAVVTLARLFWVRGKTTASSDVKYLYLVFQRAFDVRELLFFPEQNFNVREIKAHLPDVFTSDEPGRFQERFRHLLGVESERALRLLHKTQSAKNMGDLNTFLRDFMLDEPETFGLARNLVEQFGELNDAYRAVKDARLQLETLEPARVAFEDLQAAQLRKNELDELTNSIDGYCEQRRKVLIEDGILLTRAELEVQGQKLVSCEQRVRDEDAKLNDLKGRHVGEGGGVIARLEGELAAEVEKRSTREGKRELVRTSCRTLQWSAPDTAPAFFKHVESARRFVEKANDDSRDRQEQRGELHSEKKAADAEFTRLRVEIDAMERKTSNLPAFLLDARESLAARLKVEESELPFVAELLAVKSEEARWQGAIERVLHGFARSLLVPQALYEKVSRHVNEMRVGGRLIYLRMLPQAGTSQAIPHNAVYRKLDFAKSDAANWVREELKARFEYLCTETLEGFRTATKAVTLAGQVKHNASRHEKNDRFDINDQREWVLGFDNQAKLKLFKEQALACVDRSEAARIAIAALDAEGNSQTAKLMACNSLINLQWDEIDVTSSLLRIEELTRRLAEEKGARPELAELAAQIDAQEAVLQAVRKTRDEQAGEVGRVERELIDLGEGLQELRAELLRVTLTPYARENLDVRFAPFGAPTIRTLDGIARKVEQALNAERLALQERGSTLTNTICKRFEDFIRQWRPEAEGLDASLASAPDFFAKLERLKNDGLPQYEARFQQLLNEQNDQNLTRLQSQLELERKAIRDRMELVNNGLATTAYNPGTHLTIQTKDRQLEDVIAFKQELRQSLSHSLSNDPQEAENRFKVIHALVKRFASQDPGDVRWRELVLDVRKHVEFLARELYDVDGREAEVLRSGSGKSGGQRQKLAATCLAAALSYQLGGREQSLPRFSTVVMDEAFDKSDSDFTRVAMDVFKTFGFQMIVATPLKSVMTLEPYIGGACFVHNEDRKTSRIIEIAYDHEAGRLKFSSEQRHDVEEATAA